jgi:hypothetical protein
MDDLLVNGGAGQVTQEGVVVGRLLRPARQPKRVILIEGMWVFTTPSRSCADWNLRTKPELWFRYRTKRPSNGEPFFPDRTAHFQNVGVVPGVWENTGPEKFVDRDVPKETITATYVITGEPFGQRQDESCVQADRIGKFIPGHKIGG